MNDAEVRAVEVLEVVRVVERLQGLAEHADVHRERERVALLPEDARERDALEIVHDHEVTLTLGADLVRLHDVRVVQAGREARLLQEHLEEARVLDELRLQLLDHEKLAETRRAGRHGQGDDSHASAGDFRHELILAKLLRQEFSEGYRGPKAQGKRSALTDHG